MKMRKILQRGPECIISMIISLAAFVFVPEIVEAGIGKESNMLLGMLGILICCAAALALVARLRYRAHKHRKETYLPSLGRALLLAMLYLLLSIVLGLLSGAIAVVTYGALSKVLSMDQIKGIIDILVTALTLAVMPLFVNVFWTQIKSKESCFTALKQGLRLRGKAYLKVLTSLMLCLATGWLLLTVFHYLPANAITTAAKVLAFGTVGTISLLVTEQQCAKGVCCKWNVTGGNLV